MIKTMSITKHTLTAVRLLVPGLLITGAELLAMGGGQAPVKPGVGPVAAAPAQEQSLPPRSRKPSERVDGFGDPLPPDALLRLGSTQLRHPGSATSVVYVGDLLVSSGRDGLIRFWDRVTGKELRHFRGAEGQLFALACSPDRNLLAGVGPDGDVCLWDAATGNELQRFKGVSSSPIQPTFSSDGNMVAIGDKAGVRIWDVKNGKSSRMLDVPGYVLAVNFAPDGRSLAASASDQTVRIWATDSGKLLHQLVVDTSFPAENGRRPTTFRGVFVNSLTFSRDSKSLLTSGPGGTRIWDASAGNKLHLMPGLLLNRLGTLDLSTLSPDGRLLAVTTPEGVIGVWDWSKGKEILKLRAHPDRVLSVAFDGTTLASLADGPIRQWDVVTGQPKGDQTGHQDGVASVAYAPDGATIVTAGWYGTVRQWEAQTGKELRRWEVPLEEIEKARINPTGMRHVVVSPDGKFIAALRGDWVAVIWDAASAKEVYRFPRLKRGVLTGRQADGLR